MKLHIVRNKRENPNSYQREKLANDGSGIRISSDFWKAILRGRDKQESRLKSERQCDLSENPVSIHISSQAWGQNKDVQTWKDATIYHLGTLFLKVLENEKHTKNGETVDALNKEVNMAEKWWNYTNANEGESRRSSVPQASSKTLLAEKKMGRTLRERQTGLNVLRRPCTTESLGMK